MPLQQIFAELSSSTPDGLAPLSHLGVLVMVCSSCGLCILWGCVNGFVLLRTSSYPPQDIIRSAGSDAERMNSVVEMNSKVLTGIKQYLTFNIIVWLIFTVIFFLIIAGALESFQSFYSSLAYLIGALNAIFIGVFVSMVSGISHSKVCNGARDSIYTGHKIAKNSAIFQSFFTVGWNVLVISMCLLVYEDQKQGKYKREDIIEITQALIAYSFGNGTIALLARITSSIYAKSADAALPLLKQMQRRFPTDSKNPIIISKAVGQTLNKSLSNSLMLMTLLSTGITVATAAAGTSVIGTDQQGQIIFDVSLQNLYLPSILVSFGLFFCFIFSVIGGSVLPSGKTQQIKLNYLIQLGSTFGFMLGFSSLACYLCLPAEFQISSQKQVPNEQPQIELRYPYHAYLCIVLGMVTAFLTMFIEQTAITAQYFINYMLQPCHTGAATSIIYGLSFGYFFNLFPILLVATTAFLSCYWMGVFGVSLAAIGFMTLLPLYFMINSIYSITENASLLGYINGMSDQTINSLVSLNSSRKSYQPHLHIIFNAILALLGYAMVLMFIIDSQIQEQGKGNQNTRITDSLIIFGLFLGVIFPNIISFNFVFAIRRAALPICQILKGQAEDMPGILQGNVQPQSPAATKVHAIVSTIQLLGFIFQMFIPFLFQGLIAGPKGVLGLVTSMVITGVQLSLSSATSGMIWTSVRNQIHLGQAVDQDNNVIRSESQSGKAADVSADIGNTFKDGIALIIPVFIIFVQLMSCSLGKIYTDLHV